MISLEQLACIGVGLYLACEFTGFLIDRHRRRAASNVLYLKLDTRMRQRWGRQ